MTASRLLAALAALTIAPVMARADDEPKAPAPAATKPAAPTPAPATPTPTPAPTATTPAAPTPAATPTPAAPAKPAKATKAPKASKKKAPAPPAPPAPPPEPVAAPAAAPAPEPATPTTTAQPPPVSAAAMDEPSRDVEPRTYSYAAETISTGDIRDNVRDWAVGPPGWDVGAELRLITSDQGLSGAPNIGLSDIGLLRARIRITASKRIEQYGAVDILAKQPSYTEELVLQGATFGLKIAVSRKWAVMTQLSGGPTLDNSGFYGSAGTALVYRHHPDETLSFQATAGASATGLRLDEAAEHPWLTEASAGGTIMIHSPNGWFGMWLGAGLNIPVVHSDAIEPGTRLDLTLGTVYAVVKDWDIYVEAGILDRGDRGRLETQLPILDGGFDQRTILIGVTRRFEGKRASHQRSGDALLQLGS